MVKRISEKEKTKGKMILGRERKFYQFSGLTRQSRFVTGRYKFIKLSGMCLHMKNLTDWIMGSTENHVIP